MTETQKMKLQALRQKYQDDESRLYINSLEKELTKLIEESGMKEHPVFKAIAEDAAKKLNEINTLLMNDNSLDEKKRAALFHEKKVWSFNLQRFGMSTADQAIALLEKTIDEKLSQ